MTIIPTELRSSLSSCLSSFYNDSHQGSLTTRAFICWCITLKNDLITCECVSKILFYDNVYTYIYFIKATTTTTMTYTLMYARVGMRVKMMMIMREESQAETADMPTQTVEPTFFHLSFSHSLLSPFLI